MTEHTDTHRTTSCARRTALATIGAAAAVGLAGCITGASEGASSPTDTAEDDPDPTDTPEDNADLETQLAKAREATAKYTDPKNALEDGFKPGGPYVPGMGWHWQHPQRGRDAARNGFDIEKPTLLTYLNTDDGIQLGAIEWGAPVGAVPENPDLFADEDGSEQWHVHKAATHVFALPDGKQTRPENVPFEEWVKNDNWAEFRPPDSALEAGDVVSLNWGELESKQGECTERIVDVAATHPDLNTLHAWVHTENPEGVFHPTNPDYGGESSH